MKTKPCQIGPVLVESHWLKMNLAVFNIKVLELCGFVCLFVCLFVLACLFCFSLFIFVFLCFFMSSYIVSSLFQK